MKLTVTQLPVTDIHLPPRLIKEHPERQVGQIADSIRAFGFNDPVAIDEKGEIIEGAGRVLAARKLGLDTIPAIRLKHLSPAQKRAYRLAHNKIALNSGFDLEALRIELEAISQLDETLLALTGFEPVELDDLMKVPDLPDLAPELTETLKKGQSITCPHCGADFHV